MRIQAQRIPPGHVLIVQNGKLIAVPAVGNRTVHSVHVAGVATGEIGNALATPFMLAMDIVKSVGKGIAGSQYGQSTVYGWDKAEMRKAEWTMGRQLKKCTPQANRIMLIETVQGAQKGNWAILVAKMTDDQVTRELARRSVDNPYIDEQLTYGGQEIDYSETEVKADTTKAKEQKFEAHPGIVDPRGMPAFAQ